MCIHIYLIYILIYISEKNVDLFNFSFSSYCAIHAGIHGVSVKIVFPCFFMMSFFDSLNNDLLIQKALEKSYRKRFHPSLELMIQHSSSQSFKLQF